MPWTGEEQTALSARVGNDKTRRLTIRRAIWITIALVILPWILQTGSAMLVFAARRAGVALWFVGNPVASVFFVWGMNVGVTVLVVGVLVARTRDYRVPMLGRLSSLSLFRLLLPVGIGLGVGAVYVALLYLTFGQRALTATFQGHSLADFPESVLVGYILITAFVTPVLEEIVYHGVLFDALCRRYRLAIVVAVVTVLFWVMHVPKWFAITGMHIVPAIGLFIMALILIGLRVRTRGIVAPMLAHACYNLVLLVAAVFGTSLLPIS